MQTGTRFDISLQRTWKKGRVALCFMSGFALLTPLVATAATPAGDEKWVGSWAAAPFAHDFGPADPDFGDATLREIVHPSIAGSSVRLRFSNEFGVEPLKIDMVHVGLSAGNDAVQPGSDHPVTFNGQPSISIPPGAYVVSDAVAMPTQPFANLAISLHLPAQQITTPSMHASASQTNYIAAGNEVAAPSLSSPTVSKSWYFLKGVDVQPVASDAATVVAFGDSITDGAGSTENANARWPDVLAQRLQASDATKRLAVIDEGIGGNRVLRDGTAPSALARFDRDVLAQSGVKYVIVLESINDIGRLAKKNDPIDAVTAADLEQGLAQLVTRSHEHGIKVFGATLTPYKGAGYYSQSGEQVREAVNQWIRTSGTFDGVVDFEKAVADPANPEQYIQADQRGDQLHPNDTGYKAMGNAIDLQLFQTAPSK